MRFLSIMRHILLRQSLIYTGIIVCALLYQGCADQSTNPPNDVAPTFKSINENIFEKNCTTSSCHGTLGFRGGLVLEGDGVYDHLVGVSPTNTVALSRGLLLVAPGKPDSSFLLVKLTVPGPGEGDLMPYGNSQLSSQQIEAIRTWITNGAKRE